MTAWVAVQFWELIALLPMLLHILISTDWRMRMVVQLHSALHCSCYTILLKEMAAFHPLKDDLPYDYFGSLEEMKKSQKMKKMSLYL